MKSARLILLGSALAIAACGGGGDDPFTNPQQPAAAGDQSGALGKQHAADDC